MRLHKLADIQQILLAGDKGTGNIIHAVLDAEGKIALVLLVEIHLPEHLAGKAHALAVGQFSANQNGAVDIRTSTSSTRKLSSPLLSRMVSPGSSSCASSR